MTYRGIVRNGVVVLGETAELPEGMEVRVEPIARGESLPSDGPTLVEQFRDVIGTVPELPSNRWEAFCAALDRPPKEIPALRKLLAEKSLLDGN